jgi:hypothetical protein
MENILGKKPLRPLQMFITSANTRKLVDTSLSIDPDEGVSDIN